VRDESQDEDGPGPQRLSMQVHGTYSLRSGARLRCCCGEAALLIGLGYQGDMGCTSGAPGPTRKGDAVQSE
jgi:hypothetical protein